MEKNIKNRFALVDGVRSEAQRGLRGICECCESEMIAKCGNRRIKHWAHKSKVRCDPWREGETDWHKMWKNLFCPDWQEIVHKDPATGEKHIADIKTDKGFVIELQHSPIKPDEIKSREGFYKNMVWVVDGTHLKNDYPRFSRGFNTLKPMNNGLLSISPEACFPESWCTNTVPVYFDFQGIDSIDETDKRRANLWCLFPRNAAGHAVIAPISRKLFVELSLTNPDILRGKEPPPQIQTGIRQIRLITLPRIYLPPIRRRHRFRF